MSGQYEITHPVYVGIDFDSLSNLRVKAIKDVIPRVFPSTEGDAKFSQIITSDAIADARKLMPNYTTCEALPSWYFRQLGLHSSLCGKGLIGVRDAAIRLGCWRSNNELHAAVYAQTFGRPQLPNPGDVYLLSMARNDNEIAHIGIIMNPYLKEWMTADAGQGGSPQKALYIFRKWRSDTRQLDGETYTRSTNRPPRRLIGWVDIDRALELS